MGARGRTANYVGMKWGLVARLGQRLAASRGYRDWGRGSPLVVKWVKVGLMVMDSVTETP